MDSLYLVAVLFDANTLASDTTAYLFFAPASPTSGSECTTDGWLSNRLAEILWAPVGQGQ